jgi:hypothetical protein
MWNETLYWGPKFLALDSNTFISFSAEPFLPSILSHGLPSGSAYPPNRAQAFQPTSIDWQWSNASLNSAFVAGFKKSTRLLRDRLRAEGQDIEQGTPYGNYASPWTPVKDLFGVSLPRLKKIKAVWDPEDVMGQTGGWKIPAS